MKSSDDLLRLRTFDPDRMFFLGIESSLIKLFAFFSRHRKLLKKLSLVEATEMFYLAQMIVNPNIWDDLSDTEKNDSLEKLSRLTVRFVVNAYKIKY